MKRTILGMLDAGETLILQASEAVSRYREAEAAGKPLEEVQLLRLLAESLCQVVTDFQLRAQGVELPTLH
ncbi:hypothetical protein WEU41_07170 [Pseudomonas fragi]